MRRRGLEWIVSVVAVAAAAAGLAAVGAASTPDPVTSPPVETTVGPAASEREEIDLGGLSRAELNARCEGCHAQEAAEWRDSPHRTSYADPVFARSFAREPRASCRGCHAPEADPTHEPPAWAAANGVSCVTCHLDEDGRIMATTSADIDAAPHDLRPTTAFEGEAACARCHEFDFPRTPRDRDPGPMQLTITEHTGSEYADIACADCHMGPEGDDGHAGHGFHVTRNEALLRDAIAVDVRRDDGKLVFDLTPIGVGHAFPTGDLFRRLELRAEAIDDDGRVVSTAFRYLARHFPPPRWERRHGERPEVPDDRLRGPATIELALDDVAAPHLVRWSVRYQRVDQRFAEQPQRSTLSGETVLAEGWS